jgi:MSHA pilin protein MshD
MRGFSLIELLVFIVIVGIAATAMLAVMGNLTRQSAGLLPEKQAQAIAAGLLDEILGQPHTFCDPDAPNAATATAATTAACGGDHENNLGPEAGETRGGATPFDNVNDYNGYGPVAVIFPDGSATTNLPGYVAQVQVQGAGTIAGVPAAQTLRVTVTVTAPNGVVARQEGVRIRYAPNT